MARYTDSKCKICRREQQKLFLKGARCYTPKCSLTRRQTLPGVHPTSMRRPTEYSVQFREKQKVKRTYGLTEKQFRRFFKDATKAKSNTGVRFLQLLEMRLDNVVYRLGFAPSRQTARQLVLHNHVRVNDKKVDIPSYVVKAGDKVSFKPKSTEKEFAKFLTEQTKDWKTPKWLNKAGKFMGEVVKEPTRDMIDDSFQEQLIVELYSR